MLLRLRYYGHNPLTFNILQAIILIKVMEAKCMKVYVGLQKIVKGGAVAESYFFDSGETNASYLDLIATAQEHFSNSDEVVRCPVCHAVMIFDDEQSAVSAVRNGCNPCSSCSK